jgi:hypothetical protein
MNKKLEALPTEAFGLLANGSSGRWDIAVDELLGGDEPDCLRTRRWVMQHPKSIERIMAAKLRREICYESNGCKV